MTPLRELETSRVDHGAERTDVIASATIPTEHGPFRFVVFRCNQAGSPEHVAMIRGDVRGTDVLVRIHSECLTSEVFASVDCACAAALRLALRRIANEDRGIVVYLRQGKGGGYAAAGALLRDLGVLSVRLLTGDETKLLPVGELGTLPWAALRHPGTSHCPHAPSVPDPVLFHHPPSARASLPSGALP